MTTRSKGGSVEPWHLLRLHPTSQSGGQEGSLLLMPQPRKVLRHALPVVLEGVVGPLVLFYVLLVVSGFRGALIAALAWSIWPSVGACSSANGYPCCCCSEPFCSL